MATFEVIVTDVTAFGDDLFCVAGWDRLSGKMIRPEPPGASEALPASRFWDRKFVGAGKVFQGGNTIRFEGKAAPTTFPFPHATEDVLVDVNSITILSAPAMFTLDIAKAVAGSVSKTITQAFDGGIKVPTSAKPYVSKGHKGRSLGALELQPQQIQFHVNNYNPNRPKLRAYLNLGDRRYDLSVPAVAPRERWKSSGLGTLRNDLASAKLAHVRVGLSRTFPEQPNECYLQINGLYLL